MSLLKAVVDRAGSGILEYLIDLGSETGVWIADLGLDRDLGLDLGLGRQGRIGGGEKVTGSCPYSRSGRWLGV